MSDRGALPVTSQPEAQAVCEHFYASHCYRGMDIRLCMTCHEPDWDDLAGNAGCGRPRGPPAVLESATIAPAGPDDSPVRVPPCRPRLLRGRLCLSPASPPARGSTRLVRPGERNAPARGPWRTGGTATSN